VENWSVSFSPGFGFSVADNPVQKLAWFAFNQSVRSESDEVQNDWNSEKNGSGGNGEVENKSVGVQSEACNQTEFWDWKVVVEGSIVIRGDAWVDVLIQVDLVLGYLSDWLLFLQKVEDNQIRVIEAWIWKGLN